MQISQEATNLLLNLLVYGMPVTHAIVAIAFYYRSKKKWWGYGLARGRVEGRADGMSEALQNVRMSGHTGGPASAGRVVEGNFGGRSSD